MQRLNILLAEYATVSLKMADTVVLSRPIWWPLCLFNFTRSSVLYIQFGTSATIYANKLSYTLFDLENRLNR